MNMVKRNEQKQIAEEIRNKRYSGDIENAISICRHAIGLYPEENIFYKFLGDMEYSIGRYWEALDCYLDFLKRIGDKPYLITNFFRFVNKLYSNIVLEQDKQILQNKLISLLDNADIAKENYIKLTDFIFYLFDFQNEEIQQYINSLAFRVENRRLRTFIDKSDREKDGRIYVFFFMIRQQIKNPKFSICADTYKVIVAAMEKRRFYQIALELTEKMLKKTQDGVVIRTLLRLCRQLGDYSVADKYLVWKPQTAGRDDFNIQYELVYYYKEKKDMLGLNKALNRIRSAAQGNMPISKTLYNLYVQFDMLSEAEAMINHMERLNQRKNGIGEDTAAETDEGVWRKLRDIISEQDHNRQLIAMKDLIKGFSHELGQPLTNIRYDIDFYYMKRERGLASEEDINNTLANVLKQIIRIDKLIKRFAPIFSSRNVEMDFGIKEEIEKIFFELDTRLKSNGIKYQVTGTDKIELFGDPLKFHQIFYNLIINSIHAIKESGCDGFLKCTVGRKQGKIFVEFSDNGKGIPDELLDKVFEPFFSTKKEKIDHTKDEGGEGLGLYIVWNIVKMFSGNIRINRDYKKGAQFVLEFTDRKENKDV